MEIKKNISLWVGLAIPVVMIILVALAIYIPKLTAPKPQVSFVYVSGNYNYAYPSATYSVVGGKITKVPAVPTVESSLDVIGKPLPPVPASSVDQKIYVYDVKQQAAREVSFEEAKNFNLDSNQISADGFEVVNGSNSGPFSNGDYNARYIKGHKTSTRLNINSPTGYYDFIFMGWIKE